MKKFLLSVSLIMGVAVLQALGLQSNLTISAATYAVSLADHFTGTVPEQGDVDSFYDDGELKIKFDAAITINASSTDYPKWLKNSDQVKLLDDPYGNDVEVAVSSATLSVVKLYSDSYAPDGAGTYSLVIPDGYLCVDSEPAEGMTLTWQIRGHIATQTNSYTFKFADATDIDGTDYASGAVTGKSNPTFSLGELNFDAHYSGTGTVTAAYQPLLAPESASGDVTGFLRFGFTTASTFSSSLTVTAPEGVTLTSLKFNLTKALTATNATKVNAISDNGDVAVNIDDVVWKCTDPNGVQTFTITFTATVARLNLEFGSVDVECLGVLSDNPDNPNDQPDGPALDDIVENVTPYPGDVRSLFEDGKITVSFTEDVTINYANEAWPYWDFDGNAVYTYASESEIYTTTRSASTKEVIFSKGNFTATSVGIYSLVIPDGFFLCDGKATKGTSITYLLEEGEINPDDYETGVSVLSSAKDLNIVTVDGKIIAKDSNESILPSLPQGIYLINGKKIQVRK